jgi:hypothetical protein
MTVGNSMTPTEDKTGFSWNTHYILTRAALKNAGLSMLNANVAVVRLEDFLLSAQKELREIVNRYWGLIAKKRGLAEPCRELLAEVKTESDFVEAMGLNPDVPFHYVRALTPEEVSLHVPHDQSREGPPGNSYVQTSSNETIPAMDVLSTFSDEPDWGMDQDLFVIEKYGYGPPPYGSAAGMSSQAPFHMAFLHENRLMTTIVPRVRTNFMAERFQVFLSLARLAFKKKTEYWGWRFLAWAMHYLQDLTEPYHARAIPPSKFRMFRRLVLNPHFWRSPRLKQNYLRNRHMLFEATVHFMLNSLAKNGTKHPFVEAMAGEDDSYGGTLDEVMRESAQVPARLAAKIDFLTVRFINDPRVEDINCSLQSDPDARIDQAFLRASAERPQVLKELVDLVCACLSEAGKVTRYAVRLVQE